MGGELLNSGGEEDIFSIGEILESLDKEQRKIKIRSEKRKFGKDVTVIEGISEDAAPEITKHLKSKLACGGTYKNGRIELQGAHKLAVKQILQSLGYPEENIILVD
ncbi:MAG: stress response translation initiation inhibitor YciH [Thermoproteota archaeon]|jgi:translation initiation factor 1|nr:stress response translation initiation inhibitor YciH [Thermoproteota archaeon]